MDTGYVYSIEIVYVKSKHLVILYVCDVRENNAPGPLKGFCSSHKYVSTRVYTPSPQKN